MKKGKMAISRTCVWPSADESDAEDVASHDDAASTTMECVAIQARLLAVKVRLVGALRELADAHRAEAEACDRQASELEVEVYGGVRPS